MSDASDTDAPSLDALARRYLDLWQDQMARLADDPATTDMLARTFTLLTRSAQAYAAAAAPADGSSSDDDAPNDDATRPSRGRGAAASATGAAPDVRAEGPAGAEAVAPVPGGGGVDVSVLLDRITALEKRVEELEHGGRPRKPAAPSGPARRRNR